MAIADDRFIFAFERADVLGVGERTLLNQLCLQTSTPLLEQPEVYLTGERRDLAPLPRPLETRLMHEKTIVVCLMP